MILRNSEIDYFLQLIKEKKFIDAVEWTNNLYSKIKMLMVLENIFIKEKINENEITYADTQNGEILNNQSI